MASLGDVIVVTGNTESTTFFGNYSGITLFEDGSANINGDDAIELFSDESVIDTYGVIDTDGTGEPWEYSNGYAVRTEGQAGAFSLTNYNIVDDGLDGLDEAAQIQIIGQVFNLQTAAIPEPSSLALIGLAGFAGLVRRRR